MYKKVSIMVFALIISIGLVSCKDNNIVKNDPKENFFISEVSDFNNLSPESKNSFDCNKMSDSRSQQYCNNNKLKLKVDELVNSQDIAKSIWKCWSFVKSNAGVYKNDSDCRLKIVLTRYFAQFDKQYNLWNKQKPVSCDILKTYWEDTICKDTLAKIQKYNEFKQTEKVFNEYRDIIPQ